MRLTPLTTTTLLLSAALGTLAAPRPDNLTPHPSSESPPNPTTTTPALVPAPIQSQRELTPRYIIPFIGPELFSPSPNPNPQPGTDPNADAKEGGVGAKGRVQWIGARSSSGGGRVISPVTRQAVWMVYGLVLAPAVLAGLEVAGYLLG
jgi:hypothetical protein